MENLNRPLDSGGPLRPAYVPTMSREAAFRVSSVALGFGATRE